MKKAKITIEAEPGVDAERIARFINHALGFFTVPIQGEKPALHLIHLAKEIQKENIDFDFESRTVAPPAEPPAETELPQVENGAGKLPPCDNREKVCPALPDFFSGFLATLAESLGLHTAPATPEIVEILDRAGLVSGNGGIREIDLGKVKPVLVPSLKSAMEAGDAARVELCLVYSGLLTLGD